MPNKYIYHIVTLTEWELQKNAQMYIHSSLAIEGFIHASTAEQLQATIQRYYANEESVMILKIEVAKLKNTLKYELAPSINQLFPHIFGALNSAAIVEVREVEVGGDTTDDQQNDHKR
jgi:uncharacterized protein (DUF952 family)